MYRYYKHFSDKNNLCIFLVLFFSSLHIVVNFIQYFGIYLYFGMYVHPGKLFQFNSISIINANEITLTTFFKQEGYYYKLAVHSFLE